MKNALGHSMTGDLAARFLYRFEQCRKSIEEEERLIKLLERHTESADAACPHATSLFAYLAPSKEEVERRLVFHYRLYEKYLAALCAGVRRMKEKSLRDYLIWHYLYRLTNEDIAEVMHYSVRQIYRQSTQAKCALSKTLRLPRQAKVYKFHTFHVRDRYTRDAVRLAS